MENEDEQPESTESSKSTQSWEECIPIEISAPIEAAKRLALASLGAVTLATEATDELFQQLVKRGEQSKDELARELEDVKQRSVHRRDDATAYARSRMDTLLNRVSMASKADMDSINARLAILTQKIEELQAGESGTTRATHTPPETGSE